MAQIGFHADQAGNTVNQHKFSQDQTGVCASGVELGMYRVIIGMMHYLIRPGPFAPLRMWKHVNPTRQGLNKV